MKFILELFLVISGVGAASGLYYDTGTLFMVSDNSNYLYHYHISEKTLEKSPLLKDRSVNENVSKKEKLDLESITKEGRTFYMFGSGSKSNRTHLFMVDDDRLDRVVNEDLAEAYSLIQEKTSISPEDFNIEGAIVMNDTSYFFNRGNGPNAKNGIIRVLMNNFDVAFFPITLPEINGQNAGFTDATFYANKFHYLAAAEDSNSNYHDGKIGGSQYGVIDPKSMKVERSEKISDTHKFEGITLYKNEKKHYTFLLCEDPDNESMESTIYSLTIQK